MKNKTYFLIIIISLILTSPCKALNSEKLPNNDSLRLEDMVITLLMPEIQEAVNHFYEPYLTTNPQVATFSTDIFRIDGSEQIHEGNYNSNYEVVVRVLPYVGPHDTVGIDEITFKFNPSGSVITNFKHIKSYRLPSNLESLVKKALP